jgi:hypothetical protein
MACAVAAKTARERAAIAANLLKTIKPWPEGWGLGNHRNFANCFMMNDGDEVLSILIARARREPSLLAAMKRHGDQCSHWVKQIESA